MKTYSMVSADFGFLIVGIILIILVCVLPLVHQESLMLMEDTTTTKNKSDITAPEAKETLLLEIAYRDNGKVQFFATPPAGKRSQYSSKEQMIKLLKQSMPQDVRLRVDRRVPTGITQDLALAGQDIGARVWQVSGIE